MVFVILGTQDKVFPRLLTAIEEQIKKGIIDKAIVQAGQTFYQSNKMEIFDFIPRKKMLEYIKKSDYIICHGGVGTILESLDLGKKIIAIPRLKQYGEHENDHQLQIVGEFVERGFVLTCDNLNELDKVIERLKTFKPKQYQSNNENFVNLVRNKIEG